MVHSRPISAVSDLSGSLSELAGIAFIGSGAIQTVRPALRMKPVGQILVSLETTDGGDEEEHEQHSQKHHVYEHPDHTPLVLVLDPHDIANRI